MLAIKDKVTNSFFSKEKVTNLKMQQMAISDNHNPNSWKDPKETPQKQNSKLSKFQTVLQM